MYGVRASLSPTAIRNWRLVEPLSFLAVRVTLCSPLAVVLPVMMPVSPSSASPSGNPAAVKVIGRSPVAGMR